MYKQNIDPFSPVLKKNNVIHNYNTRTKCILLMNYKFNSKILMKQILSQYQLLNKLLTILQHTQLPFNYII